MSDSAELRWNNVIMNEILELFCKETGSDIQMNSPNVTQDLSSLVYLFA